MKDKVLEVMKNTGKPMSAGEVEKALQADRKEIDKAFKAGASWMLKRIMKNKFRKS